MLPQKKLRIILGKQKKQALSKTNKLNVIPKTT